MSFRFNGSKWRLRIKFCTNIEQKHTYELSKKHYFYEHLQIWCFETFIVKYVSLSDNALTDVVHTRRPTYKLLIYIILQPLFCYSGDNTLLNSASAVTFEVSATPFNTRTSSYKLLNMKISVTNGKRNFIRYWEL